MTALDASVSFSATLHGLDPEKVTLRRDDEHRARFLALTGNVAVRVDLKYPEDLERDRLGLLKLAEVAVQAAAEIAELQAEGGR